MFCRCRVDQILSHPVGWKTNLQRARRDQKDCQQLEIIAGHNLSVFTMSHYLYTLHIHMLSKFLCLYSDFTYSNIWPIFYEFLLPTIHSLVTTRCKEVTAAKKKARDLINLPMIQHYIKNTCSIRRSNILMLYWRTPQNLELRLHLSKTWKLVWKDTASAVRGKYTFQHQPKKNTPATNKWLW